MVEFREPPASSGSQASTEVAATLRDRPGEWALLEEYTLPQMAGNEDIAAVRSAIGSAAFPTTADELAQEARSTSTSGVADLLSTVARSDAKTAEKAGKSDAVRVYGSVDDVLKAVLAVLKLKVRAKASSRTGVIKDGRVKAFAPAGVFDSKSTTERVEGGGSVVCVYAMFQGEDHALPADQQPAARRAAKKTENRPPAFPEPQGAETSEMEVDALADAGLR